MIGVNLTEVYSFLSFAMKKG